MSISSISKEHQENLIQAIRENLINDYDYPEIGALTQDTINKVCLIVRGIIAAPTCEQEATYQAYRAANRNLHKVLEYAMKRLRKYSAEVELNQELTRSDQPRAVREIQLRHYAELEFNPHFEIDKKIVDYVKGTHLGDGRTRRITKYENTQNPGLLELSSSIWVAEPVNEKQYIWRARRLVDQQDVYKLLKFLTGGEDPAAYQSIHINTGCHGTAGDRGEPDTRIKNETLNSIGLLKNSDLQDRNFSIEMVGPLTNPIYPPKANHIIDTMCEAAMGSLELPEIGRTLQFLSHPAVAEREPSEPHETKAKEYRRLWRKGFIGRRKPEIAFPLPAAPERHDARIRDRDGSMVRGKGRDRGRELMYAEAMERRYEPGLCPIQFCLPAAEPESHRQKGPQKYGRDGNRF